MSDAIKAALDAAAKRLCFGYEGCGDFWSTASSAQIRAEP